MLQSVSPPSRFSVLELWWQQSVRQCLVSSSAGFGEMPVRSRGGSSAEWKLEKESERGGSILTRAGILEAVFEQGEEFSVRGRIRAREEKTTSTSTVQGMKELEKQWGIKLCKKCWVGPWARAWVEYISFTACFSYAAASTADSYYRNSI